MSAAAKKSTPSEKRFCELETLEDGWLDGEGLAPNEGALEGSRSALDGLVPLGLPWPRIFATPEGGVQMEWTTSGREMSLVIDPDGSAYAISVDLSSGTVMEFHTESGDTESIVSFLGTHLRDMEEGS